MIVSAIISGAVGAWGGNGVLADPIVQNQVRHAIAMVLSYATEGNLLSKLAECIDNLLNAPNISNGGDYSGNNSAQIGG